MQRLYNLLQCLFIIPCFLSWLPVETFHATYLQFATAPVHNTMFLSWLPVETFHATSLQFATAPVHNTIFLSWLPVETLHATSLHWQRRMFIIPFFFGITVETLHATSLQLHWLHTNTKSTLPLRFCKFPL